MNTPGTLSNNIKFASCGILFCVITLVNFTVISNSNAKDINLNKQRINRESIQPVSNTNGILKSNTDRNISINIRSGPSRKRSVKHQGKPGDIVQVLGKIKPPGDSHIWYQVKFGDKPNDIGWIRDDVIKLSPVNPPNAETLIYFATNTKTVRIHGLQQRYINIYDNQKEVTDLSDVPVAKIPKIKSDKDDNWISYIAVKDGKAYYVRFLPFSAAELIISNSNDGKIILREYGLRQSGLEYENKL
ncbi:MAG: SH3 domain-containing protein [Nostocaceae cyanobacterium]|nr:SH3 domain-containing protein [Nostocaceae cyanobacterium]